MYIPSTSLTTAFRSLSPELTSGTSDEDSAYKERLYSANREAAKFYHEVLYRPEGKSALDYLHKRGLTDNVIRQFGLGAAPDKWSELSNYLRKKGYTISELEAAGLTVTKPPKEPGGRQRYFDMFRKGEHVIETEYYIDRAGIYETGTCTVGCAYAPEFRATTKSNTLEINNK